MWYYDDFLSSPDIAVKLVHKGGSGPSTSYSDPDVGILGDIPSPSITHEWKDAGWGGGLMSTVVDSVDYSTRQAYRSIEAVTSSNSSEHSEKMQPNSNILKEFDGTTADFPVPPFNKLFLCDGQDITDTRVAALGFIEKHKLFGETNYRGSNFVQAAPGDFQYLKDFNPTADVPGSFSLVCRKFIIKNLVPQNVSITMSDNLISGYNCPLFIKLSITFIFAKLVVSDTLIDFIKYSGG